MTVNQTDIVQCIKFNFRKKNNALKELPEESDIITRFDTDTVGEIILIMAEKTPTLQFLTRPTVMVTYTDQMPLHNLSHKNHNSKSDHVQ